MNLKLFLLINVAIVTLPSSAMEKKLESLLVFLHLKNPNLETIKEEIKQKLNARVQAYIKCAKNGDLIIHEDGKWFSPNPNIDDYRFRIEPLWEDTKRVGVITTFTFGCDNSQETNMIKFEKENKESQK